MGEEKTKLMDDILEKHWRKYLINLGLPYTELTPRSKEFIFLAMKEYNKNN